MYPVINAIRNIRRQYRRYRLLVPLLLICALMTGIFMTIAVPCRLYSDQVNTVPQNYTDETAKRYEAQAAHARNFGETSSLIQFSVMLVGSVGILYVSSLMIGERMFEIGILYAVGLSRRQIFLSLFIELFVLCGGTLVTGLTIGGVAAEGYLKHQVAKQVLPEEILRYMGTGTEEIFCFVISVGILLLPMIQLALKLLYTEPGRFLRERK